MPSFAERSTELPERLSERYRVIRELGRGGHATVYEAIDEVTGQRLAIKQLHARHATGDTQVARLFELEFHTLRQLAHPRVVAVYDFHGPAACYTMELLDGEDLREQEPMPWRAVCALMVDVCSALSLLHSRRFVHRDVTPRNIRRTRDGKAKLLDFGAMVPFGTHKQAVGTPTFTAPEAANGQPLDGRADLFSLGATAYYALTGRHAYPARSFAAMRNAWRSLPAVPSRYAPDVPADLDQLVMALLSLSVARRTSSAAAVIERLTAIAGLHVEEQLLVQRSFLSTPSLVGRDAALQRIRRSMIQGARGRGSALFLTGPPGVGRSRMVDACALEARLASATVLRADAGDAQGPWGGVQSLLDQLLSEQPAAAPTLLAASASTLAHVWPRALEVCGGLAPEPAAPDVVRTSVHRALLTLMEDITRHGLLAITADDLDRVDEPTRAFIALLAPRTAGRRLVIVTAAASDALSAGFSGLSLLQREEATLVLPALSPLETEQLLRSMFGDVPNLRTLATHLHEIAKGMPRETLQLCQHLLDRDCVVYRDGSWILPSSYGRAALPSSVSEALRARIASLDPRSRSLAAAITLCDRPGVTLEQCCELLAASEREEVLSCLDALTAADIVRSRGDQYALSQPLWVAPLLSQLDPTHGRVLHARIADMFLREPGCEVLAASHLFACEQAERAIPLLLAHFEELGPRLHADPSCLPEVIRALPSDWMQTLETAIAEAERLRLPMRERLALKIALLQRLALTTTPRPDLGLEVVQQLYSDSGLRDYAQLPESLSEADRLGRAIGSAQARFDATPEHDRGLPPALAIPSLARLHIHLLGMMAGTGDVAFLRALPSLAPFAALSPAIMLVQRNIEASADYIAGRVEQGYEGYLEILARLTDPQSSGLAPGVHRYMKLAITYTVAVRETMGGRAIAFERFAILESDPLFEMNAWRLRMVWALLQGDAEVADEYARHVELLKIRNAPSQFFEGTDIWYQVLALAEIGDVSRLRASLERLDELSAHFDVWKAASAFARGQIQLLRGEHAGAVGLFELALSLTGAGVFTCWTACARGLLEALAALGRVAEARDRGRRLLSECDAAGLSALRVDLCIAMVSVELSGSDCAAALAWLQVVDELRKRWPMGGVFAGRCHELRARVALAAGDAAAFESAAQACDEAFSRSRNSILIGRYQRLLQDAERSGMLQSASVARAITAEDTAALDTVRGPRNLPRVELSASSDSRARLSGVLALVAERSSARHILLYLVRDGALVLAVSTPDCPSPSDALLSALVAAFVREEIEDASALRIDPDDLTTTTVDNADWTGPTGVQFVPALLTHSQGDRRAITGVVVYDLEGAELPSDELLAELSTALAASNDATPMLIEAPKATQGAA